MLPVAYKQQWHLWVIVGQAAAVQNKEAAPAIRKLAPLKIIGWHGKSIKIGRLSDEIKRWGSQTRNEKLCKYL